MIRSELTAAGIDDPRLRDGYRRCRELNAAHGRTFFLATRLLAPDQRPPVHALYGFARYADDILDDFDPHVGAEIRGRRLQHCPSDSSPTVHTWRIRWSPRYRHRAALSDQRRAVRGLPGFDADGPHGHRLSRPQRPQPVHAGFRGSHWAAGASDIGHGDGPRTRPRRTPRHWAGRSS